MDNKSLVKPVLLLAMCFAGAAALGAFFGRKKRRLENWNLGITGAFPRGSGATSAVTGGPPEDINGMPAGPTDHGLGTVYDGSDLGDPLQAQSLKAPNEIGVICCP